MTVLQDSATLPLVSSLVAMLPYPPNPQFRGDQLVLHCETGVSMSDSPSEGGDAIFGVISWQDSGDDDVDKLEGTTQEEVKDRPHALTFGTHGN